MKYTIEVTVVDQRTDEEDVLDFKAGDVYLAEGKIQRWQNNPKHKHYRIIRKEYKGMTPDGQRPS